MHKILTNILLSRLTPYAVEITGDHQYGFQCNPHTVYTKIQQRAGMYR
jgi:hypothetical protein